MNLFAAAVPALERASLVARRRAVCFKTLRARACLAAACLLLTQAAGVAARQTVDWRTPSPGAAPFVPQTYGEGGAAPGLGRLAPPDAEVRDGINAEMAAEIERQVREYEALPAARRGSAAAAAQSQAAPLPYPFFPQAGTLGKDIYLGNFVDLTRGAGVNPLAWDCSGRTYRGHTGHDSVIRSFREQEIGMPVFAALDGQVVGWRDDAFDKNLSCAAGSPFNYVLLHHGNQQYTIYLHFRTSSIPAAIKEVGKSIRAGTQLGSVGSSGCSTWPHLHFESWFGGLGITGLPGPNIQQNWNFIFEPFSAPGGCNPLESNWLAPAPYTGLLGYVKDVAMSAAPFPNAAPSYTDPNDTNPRTTTFTTAQSAYYRPELINLPANSTFEIIFTRPDGSTHFRLSNFFGNSTPINFPFGPWWFVNGLNMTGRWRVDLFVNNQPAQTTFFDVVSSPAQVVNHAPAAVQPQIEPAAPSAGDALTCRLQGSPAGRDPDTDVVSYRYEWKVNGVTRRNVAASAALSDMLPAGEAQPGDAVSCTVTPSDGRLSGPPAVRSVQLPGAASVAFAAAAAAVGEGAGSVALSVLRAGDASEALAVSYETANVTAKDSADYTAALGTLRFAPGETSKAIRVFVTNDAYAEAAETFTVTLRNPSGGALGAPAVLTVTVNDNDTATGPSPVRAQNFSPPFFVTQHYLDFLNREPDPAGLAHWTNQTTNCGSPDPVVCRVNTSAAFFLSIEFQETGYLVYKTFGAALGTRRVGAAAPLTLREFLADTQAIGAGVVVNQGPWQAQLEANKQAYFGEFVQRAAFASAYPQTLTAAQFADALNANAGAVLTAAERNDLVAGLNSGQLTRARVLRAVAENAAFSARENNRAFVLMQYFGYLRRNPNDAPDSNFDGYNFWLSKLNQFGGNFVNAEMVKAFITSTEYVQRFGQP
ncbi:MAG TPA: Calx-beta domain-containing protein [Pyrinomonadaceae bacterium]|jgi:murein DD-endopeptidase MepM/ murein hydrolase activator NlpD